MAKKKEEDLIGVIDNDSALERQRRKEARKKKIIFAYGIVFFLAMLVVVIFVFSKFFFSVRTITVKCDKLYDEQDILDACGVEKGSILFTVDTEAVSYSIQSTLPFVISAEVTRDYPGTLVISVKETKAEFFFEISDQYVVVSKELKVLDLVANQDKLEKEYGKLVQIEMPTLRNAVVGKVLEFDDPGDKKFIPDLLYMLDVCGMRKNVYSINAKVRFDIQLNYENNFTVKLGNTSDFESKLLFAKKIIENFEKGTGGTVDVKNPDKGYAIVDNPDNLLPK